MRAGFDDVHSDSLAGAELGTAALSAPPSSRLGSSRLVRAGWVLSAIVAGVAIFARVAARSESARESELYVEGQTLHYSDAFAARSGIRTTELTESAFSPDPTVRGKVALDPGAVAIVEASALGTVRRVAKYEGDQVKPGEALAEVASPVLARLEAASFARARSVGSATPELGLSVVRSPIEGTVIERRVVTGQSVKSARALFVVANLDRLVFEVRVAESEAHVLAIGDRAELSRENSGAAIEGKVSEIGLLTGPELGSGVLVRVAVDNAARQLRPGASVSAIIHTSGSVRAVVIPTRAVVWIAGQPAVFVEHGHNAVGATPIGLGASSGELTEVSFGLASGQRIVSDGVQSLATESAL